MVGTAHFFLSRAQSAVVKLHLPKLGRQQLATADHGLQNQRNGTLDSALIFSYS